MRARFVCSILATCVSLQACVFAAKHGGAPVTVLGVGGVSPVGMPVDGAWPAAPLSTLRFAAAGLQGAPVEALALPAQGVRVLGSAAGAVSTVLRVSITLAYAAPGMATPGATAWTVAQGSMDVGGRTVPLDGGTIELRQNSAGEWACARVELHAFDPSAPAQPAAQTAVATGETAVFGDTRSAGFVTAPAATDVHIRATVSVNGAPGAAPAANAVNAVNADTVHGASGAPAPSGAAAAVALNVRVQASVRRVSLGGGAVLSEGALTVTGPGIPPGESLTVLDGSFELDGSTAPAGAPAPAPVSAPATGGATGGARAGVSVSITLNGVRRVRSGTVLLASRSGHRWRARVTGGQVRLRQSGTESDHRVAYTADEGALEVALAADLGTGFAPPELPSADVGTAVPNVLSARANHALDQLVALAPEGSRDKKRLEAAVRYVRFTAESPQSDFYSVRVEGNRVVLLVDVSYSMSAVDPAARPFAVDFRAPATRLDVARAQLVKLLASVGPGVLVDVVSFSSQLTTMWPAPRAVNDGALDEAIHWVFALAPRDETEPEPALRAAVAMNADRVLLLSDGRPTYRAHEPAVLSLVGEMHAHGTRVDAVSVGNDGDVVPFLEQLAVAGGGSLALR